MSIDLGIVDGIWTLLVLAFFITVVARAWSRGARAEMEAAARIPLDDDEPVQPDRKAKHG